MKLLFADDERNIREILAGELEHLQHIVTLCADGLEAIESLKKESFDVLLVDLDMPGAGGLQVIEYAREIGSDADTVILTGKGTLETAIQAMHHGVSDYLTKPYKISELELLLKRIEKNRILQRKCILMENQIRRFEGNRRLIGASPAMQKVHSMIERIAQTESTVVILGETGTGKELVARAVHEKSPRSGKPFVAVNCGALPETLIESELFGHRKGSFTGADSNRTGLLEVADGGTLFLDEIGELPKGVQTKLLRFLESGEVRKIGENTSSICDVRVVCATLRNLETMVQNGEFREDLWFRINTFEIHLPPLKERKEDLPALILHLAKRFSPSLRVENVSKLFAREALDLMEQYDWPGNVRQLANTIEHAMILSDPKKELIGVDALPQSLQPDPENEFHSKHRITEKKPNRPIVNKSPMDSSAAFSALPGRSNDSPSTLRELEMQAINEALQRNHGNKSKAAEELGISLKTLYNKLNQFEEKRPA